MEKKTAIELLIRELNRRKKVVEQINDVAAYEFGIAIKIAKRYLVNEKKQIIKSNESGFKDGVSFEKWGNPIFDTAEQYYNETYNKKDHA